MRRLRINLRLLWRKILREKGTPEAIGRGFAAGVVAGMMPLIGLQTVIGIVAAWLVRGNPVAAVPAVWVSNPFTIPPLFWLEYELGSLLLYGWTEFDAPERFHQFTRLVEGGTGGMGFFEATMEISKALFNLGGAVLVPLVVGGLLLGLLAAVPSYMITKSAVRAVRERRQRSVSQFFELPRPPAGVSSAGGHDDPVEE